MAKGTKIVTVESTLLGREVTPVPGLDHLWKGFNEGEKVEVVAVFVGDLNEGGSLKLAMRGTESGVTRIGYVDHYIYGSAV